MQNSYDLANPSAFSVRPANCLLGAPLDQRGSGLIDKLGPLRTEQIADRGRKAPVAGQLRVPGHDGGGLLTGLPDQRFVGEQAEQLEAGPAAGLCRAQHVALPALLQIQTGQAEAVASRGDRIQPLAGRTARLGLGDQQAQAFGGAPAHPAAQLVRP